MPSSALTLDIMATTWPDEGKNIMTKTENSSIITTTDFSRAPHRISKRKIKIGERITREILANPKERSEILEGLAQIKRGECVVWKKKGC